MHLQQKHFFGLLNSDDSVFCWELLAYFFPLLDDFIFIFLNHLSKFSKRFPLDQSISIQGCNLLTLQISIDILSIFFNKQSFILMLHFIYFVYLHLIHLCCKLSVILISPVIPLLILVM